MFSSPPGPRKLPNRSRTAFVATEIHLVGVSLSAESAARPPTQKGHLGKRGLWGDDHGGRLWISPAGVPPTRMVGVTPCRDGRRETPLARSSRLPRLAAAGRPGVDPRGNPVSHRSAGGGLLDVPLGSARLPGAPRRLSAGRTRTRRGRARSADSRSEFGARSAVRHTTAGAFNSGPREWAFQFRCCDVAFAPTGPKVA